MQVYVFLAQGIFTDYNSFPGLIFLKEIFVLTPIKTLSL
jgi:hypothetical protein